MKTRVCLKYFVHNCSLKSQIGELDIDKLNYCWLLLIQAKITENEGKIPSITGLASTGALIAVEIRYPALAI